MPPTPASGARRPDAGRPRSLTGCICISIDIQFHAMADRSRGVDHLLPLKPKVLHVLLTLADGPRHGYSIMQEVAARTGGQVRLWPAALYGALRELEELDWIVESGAR